MTEPGTRPIKGPHDKMAVGVRNSVAALRRSGSWHTWDGRAGSTAGGPTMAAAVQWGPGGGQASSHPNTVASGPMCRTLGDPPWSRLGHAGLKAVWPHQPAWSLGAGFRAGTIFWRPAAQVSGCLVLVTEGGASVNAELRVG